MDNLKQKYLRKKNHTLKSRSGVGFELTFEEYKNLIRLSTVCDYTGVAFYKGDVPHHPETKSIERIDPSLPYQADNCCCVTVRANQLKDVIDGGSNQKINKEDTVLIMKIQQTLKSKTRQQLVSKYTKEVDMQSTTEAPVTPDLEVLTPHPHICIAKGFIAFCEQHTDSEITLPKYHRLMSRKSCEWSGKVFGADGELTGRVLIRVDKSQPHGDQNTKAVCLALSAIQKGNLFTKKQLIKFTENL